MSVDELANPVDEKFVLSIMDRLRLAYNEFATHFGAVIFLSYYIWVKFDPERLNRINISIFIIIICSISFVGSRSVQGIKAALKDGWYSSRYNVHSDGIEKHYRNGHIQRACWSDLIAVEGGAPPGNSWSWGMARRLPPTELLFKNDERMAIVPHGTWNVIAPYRPLLELVAKYGPIDLVEGRAVYLEYRDPESPIIWGNRGNREVE